MLRRLRSRQHVLGPVLGLASEDGDLRLPLLVLCDVTCEAAGVNELVTIPENVGMMSTLRIEGQPRRVQPVDG